MRDYPGGRIDLRSDTVTQPVPAMRKAMASAVVGDDVLGDDPTVIELQNRIANMLGKDAALFVPSGTMSNAIAIKSHTKPGDEIIAHKKSHIYNYEGGGYASLAGCSISLVEGDNGLMSPDSVKKAIRKVEGSHGHYPNGSLVCVENSSMYGGAVYPQQVLDDICDIAHNASCKVHLDGARIFNALTVSNVSLIRMVEKFDTISICLSKGLGTPIGSVLVGDHETIKEAHRWRKTFGGGMRQVGILAAAGLYALDNNILRISEDHERAIFLAKKINKLNKFSINLDFTETNIIFVKCDYGSKNIKDRLFDAGIDVSVIDEDVIRLVIHLHITDEDVQNIITAFDNTQ
jgi:threonine aldolase|tara:strand:+ start:837 stop:1877 length:1041 start_codon:yes stop_codon:yes gene_type:complete